MSKKILVVDDERDTLKTLKTRLETSGYKVISAVSGEECLKKAIPGRPDFILLDVLLPRLSSFRIYELLKESAKTKDIPVIMLKALIGESAEERGLKLRIIYVSDKGHYVGPRILSPVPQEGNTYPVYHSENEFGDYFLWK